MRWLLPTGYAPEADIRSSSTESQGTCWPGSLDRRKPKSATLEASVPLIKKQTDGCEVCRIFFGVYREKCGKLDHGSVAEAKQISGERVLLIIEPKTPDVRVIKGQEYVVNPDEYTSWQGRE